MDNQERKAQPSDMGKIRYANTKIKNKKHLISQDARQYSPSFHHKTT